MVSFEMAAVQVENSGNYICSASNQFGLVERRVAVNVTSAPLTVVIPQIKYFATEHQAQMEIPCLIYPTWKSDQAVIKWFFDDSEIDTTVNIFQVNNSMSFVLRSADYRSNKQRNE